MTDLEFWKNTFSKYGIKYDEAVNDGYETYTTLGTDEGNGYSGFTLQLSFDSDGKFLTYGVWE